MFVGKARQVIAAARYDVPHPAARIWHVASIPRNDMHVQVKHSLTSGLTVVIPML